MADNGGTPLETASTVARERDEIAGSAEAPLVERYGLEAAGRTRLAQVGGELGVFTPLTDAQAGEVSERNLEQIVDLLRDRVADLESRNLQLERSLKAVATNTRRSSDDFATAVTHAVDSLQSRLAEAKNPVSRFAVRSFDIDATVHVEVTPLGTVEYRFVRPEEAVDPASLSTIRLSIVPIARQEEDGAAGARPSFARQVDIEEIQGIGEVYQKKLMERNVYTIDDLLTASTRVRSRVELAAMLGVDRNRLAEWLSHAELMTVQGIGGREAEVLHHVGITTLKALAESDAGELTERYNAEVDALGRQSLHPVQEESVSGWIEAAAALAAVRVS